MITPPHPLEVQLREDFTITWVQYFLVDAEMIERVDEPMVMGGHAQPTTTGDWGHWTVGGERLKSAAVVRVHQGDTGTSF